MNCTSFKMSAKVPHQCHTATSFTARDQATWLKQYRCWLCSL